MRPDEEEEYDDEEISLDSQGNLPIKETVGESYNTTEAELHELKKKELLNINIEESIYNYFNKGTRQEVEPMVIKLNELKNVKLCGGLGACFYCRNKHIAG